MVSNLESIETNHYKNFSYNQLSELFEKQWNNIVDSTQTIEAITNEMVRKLMQGGLSKTNAIDKIVSDHKHFKGFSRPSIYRRLEDKREYKQQGGKKLILSETNVSNDTDEKSQETIQKNVNIITSTKVQDAEIIQEKVQTTNKEEIENFWVKYYLEIGGLKRTLDLLINPKTKRIIESKLYR